MKNQNEKDIDEILSEATLDQTEGDHNGLPEAPASANTRVKTKSGRQWQITMRTASVSELVKQIEIMDNMFDNKGWVVPKWQEEEKAVDKPEEKICPTCAETARKLTVKKEGANKGRQFWGCTNKSCKYFEWIS